MRREERKGEIEKLGRGGFEDPGEQNIERLSSSELSENRRAPHSYAGRRLARGPAAAAAAAAAASAGVPVGAAPAGAGELQPALLAEPGAVPGPVGAAPAREAQVPGRRRAGGRPRDRSAPRAAKAAN